MRNANNIMVGKTTFEETKTKIDFVEHSPLLALIEPNTVAVQDTVKILPAFYPDDPEKDATCYRIFLAAARNFQKLATKYVEAPPFSVARNIRDSALLDIAQELPGFDRPVRLAIFILNDLVCQGWQVIVSDITEISDQKERNETIALLRPQAGVNRHADKERVRRALMLAREEQLAEAPVRTFVRTMESRRLINNRWVSIHSLLRDGVELADALAQVNIKPNGVERDELLRSTISPYIQIVENENAYCEHTGLRLMDIWRYFRYTWLNPARSTPGRTMMLLVRDAAAENHPVIGIAALSSAIVQQSERDRIIGWTRDTVVAEIEAIPTTEKASWLLRSLDELISAIYLGDLVSPDEVIYPTETLIEQLQALGQTEKRRHYQSARTLGHSQYRNKDDWAVLAKTHLFTSKRASTLADLLAIRMRFQEAGFTLQSGDALSSALEHGGNTFRQAIGRLVRHIKATHVGINMMDISVCGSIAPYNHILGGKLVALVLASPEVRTMYKRRYGSSPSVIASSMKGEAVRREPHLVLLCTTGLFAGGSSQYNRIRIPSKLFGGRGEIRYARLDQETEFTTFHISQATQREMLLTLESEGNSSNVNSIFGEGVNPRMRKIREGLARAGFNPEHILRAGSPRSVYMIALAHNYRQMLLGQTKEPDYILPMPETLLNDDTANSRSATSTLANYWRCRWLDNRIKQPSVLAEI